MFRVAASTVFAVVAMVPRLSTVLAASTCCNFSTVPFYCAYNAGCRDHLFSTSIDEITGEARAGYVSEGDAGHVLATNASGSVPLYRLWNSALQDHFYTQDANERDSLLSSCGTWSYEGVAAYILPQGNCGTVPLYRMVKGGTDNDHFYTVNTAEMVRAVVTYGYTYEYVVGYVWP
ncbi:hypothetical protein AURDEDRAFT_163279 [Auricularia subglabra TFB-10046 SS5]|nr:hypothetical protein AURDEDRAFT_163279 [Auricularia subglabra TFB-10046 SS5]